MLYKILMYKTRRSTVNAKSASLLLRSFPASDPKTALGRECLNCVTGYSLDSPDPTCCLDLEPLSAVPLTAIHIGECFAQQHIERPCPLYKPPEMPLQKGTIILNPLGRDQRKHIAHILCQ